MEVVEAEVELAQLLEAQEVLHKKVEAVAEEEGIPVMEQEEHLF